MSTISNYYQPSFRGESFIFYYQLPETTKKNLHHCKPQVRWFNISSTRADESVLTQSCKGLNSFHRLQSKGRIFYHKENSGIAIQAATHQLFCFCIVCLVCQQLKDWLCKTVASDLCSEKGIDLANDLEPTETWHFFFFFFFNEKHYNL